MGRTLPEGVYIAPRSGSPLRLSEDGAVVGNDGERYPITDGCICFRGRDDVCVDNEETRRVDAALIEARQSGWRAAIDSQYVIGTREHRYVTEEERCGFLELLPITDASIVLEIGCSMGQHTSAVARRCSDVFALDIIPQQAQFVALRAWQEGLQNVHVACGGDNGWLPYASGVFDVVIMNLVLEWCASRSKEAHETVQRRLLGELARVLKPGGAAFVSTKNRYSLALLCGRRDEHVHRLRFGSALPRSLSAWIIRHRRLLRQSGWLHSHNKLSRMLYDAGFDSIRTFWAAPEMRYPKWFVSTDARSVRAAKRLRQGALYNGRLARAIMPLVPAGLIKHVTPGLTFVAYTKRTHGT